MVFRTDDIERGITMNFYDEYEIKYRSANAEQCKEAKAHWLKCHRENVKSKREDLTAFSAEILARIALVDGEEMTEEQDTEWDIINFYLGQAAASIEEDEAGRLYITELEDTLIYDNAEIAASELLYTISEWANQGMTEAEEFLMRYRDNE